MHGSDTLSSFLLEETHDALTCGAARDRWVLRSPVFGCTLARDSDEALCVATDVFCVKLAKACKDDGSEGILCVRRVLERLATCTAWWNVLFGPFAFWTCL